MLTRCFRFFYLPVQEQISRHKHDRRTDQAKGGTCISSGPKVLGRDQVLSGRRTRKHGHTYGYRAYHDGSNNQLLRNIRFLEQGYRDRVQRERNNEGSDSAVGKNQTGKHDYQYNGLLAKNL